MAERIIRVNKKEQKFRRQESVLMENYFKWHPPLKLKQTHQTKKHQKNDLKPDWRQENCPSRRAVSGSTTHVG
jgi:hypothetical protein